MDFDYVASGGVGVEGCGKPAKTVFRVFKFGPGALVYLCKKADRGVLERIVIKRINLVSNRQTYKLFVPIYVDTLNSLYNEDDLCTEREAVERATAFYAARLVDIDNQLSKC